MTWTRTDTNTWIAGDYRIIRWVAADRYGKHLQYAAYYKDECLNHNQQPMPSLAYAKTVCRDHALRQKVRRQLGYTS